jgi:hypothetical protein
MHRTVFWAAAAACAAAAFVSAPSAQAPRKAHWLMDGGDPARTSWQREETVLSPTSVADMRLLWKVKLDNEPREMHNLFAPLIIPDLHMPGGAREIAVVAGISDNVYGIDIESGKQIWKRHFDSTYEPTGRGGGPLCPGGQTANAIVVPDGAPGKYKVYAISWDGRLRTLDPATG